MERLKKEFPETIRGQQADLHIAALKAQAELEAMKKNLAMGKPFPDLKDRALYPGPQRQGRFDQFLERINQATG